jgi:selenide,water dikinase
VTLTIRIANIPVFAGAIKAWRAGAKTGGAQRNLEYVDPMVDWGSADEPTRALLVDPQTSGGLLVAVPAARMADYVSRVPGAVEIGEVGPRGDAAIVLE